MDRMKRTKDINELNDDFTRAVSMILKQIDILRKPDSNLTKNEVDYFFRYAHGFIDCYRLVDETKSFEASRKVEDYRRAVYERLENANEDEEI